MNGLSQSSRLIPVLFSLFLASLIGLRQSSRVIRMGRGQYNSLGLLAANVAAAVWPEKGGGPRGLKSRAVGANLLIFPATNSVTAVFMCLRAGDMSERAAEALINSVPETVQGAAAAPSFDEAFTLHHRAVFRAAYALVRDSGLAEDVTQEVFLKLYQHMGSIQNEEHVRPWLLRVAANTALNTIRGRSRSGARDEEFSVAAVVGSTPVGVEADYERRVEIEEARRALGEVREPMRSCLLLKQQGLSYREIAQALSINEANVGSLIARGRKEFMRVYGKIGGRR